MPHPIVRRLAEKGVAIVYITHRLQELSHIADTVTVLRDGKHVGTVPYAETTPDSIVHMMFGEVVQRPRPADLMMSGEPLLGVRGLSRRGKFQGVNLALHRGEILGIAGMLGSGRTELLRAIFGADRADGGSVLLDGLAVEGRSPRRMKKLGLGMVSENRKEESLVRPRGNEAKIPPPVDHCGVNASTFTGRTPEPIFTWCSIACDTKLRA